MTGQVYQTFLEQKCDFDSAHDITHIKRVVHNARNLLAKETADAQIVLAAAWLHDCVILPKNHPDRVQASALAAKKAARFLTAISFPEEKIARVKHAIESHSYSAGITPETMEAKIVQDADRLDALGAIGIARCFLVGGALSRALYHPADPFCKHRAPDDKEFTIDHFFTKLFQLPETMHTEAAREEARKRMEFMEEFLSKLGKEMEPGPM